MPALFAHTNVGGTPAGQARDLLLRAVLAAISNTSDGLMSHLILLYRIRVHVEYVQVVVRTIGQAPGHYRL